MAVNTEDLKGIFKMFNDEAFLQLKEFQKETQMEDEHLATVLGETIKSSITGSVEALEVFKKLEIYDEDKEMKKQSTLTIIAKRVREQGANIDEATGKLVYSNDKSSYVENQIDLIKEQIKKVKEDTGFVVKQGVNMELQVRHNCIIQGMDASQGYNMGIGNAGLIPSQDMHTNFFIMNKALMLNAGVVFAEDGTASFIPDNKNDAITLGKYKVDVTMPTEAS